jgi:hypothetical protein
MEDRLKKSLNTGRESRASLDQVRDAPENQSALSNERRKMWNDEWSQRALPDVPTLKGWHCCWLSTTNSYDTIEKRMRLGYVPVMQDEIPGYQNNRVKSESQEHSGHVTCNELVLYKLPMDVYQDVMTHFHHDEPQDQANKIKVDMEQLSYRDRSGRNIVSVEGDAGNIDTPKPAPIFHG